MVILRGEWVGGRGCIGLGQSEGLLKVVAIDI